MFSKPLSLVVDCRGMFHAENRKPKHPRTANIAVLIAVLLVPMVGMLALSIDVGYSMRKHDELQRAADSAALAGARELAPNHLGEQDFDMAKARVREIAAKRLGDSAEFNVLDDDIELGRFEPRTAYTRFTIKEDGIFDTVRVTLRRDGTANKPLPLFFGGIFGLVESEVAATSTAVVQKPIAIRPGAAILPFAIPESSWIASKDGKLRLRSDGKILDSQGQILQQDWSTIDFGTRRNETANLNYQMLNGLHDSHLKALYREGRIKVLTAIDSRQEIWVTARVGLPEELLGTIPLIEEKARLIPLYTQKFGKDRELEYKISNWAVASLQKIDVEGALDIHLEISEAFLYDGLLRPGPNLSVEEGVIVGAYTSPILVD